MSRIEKQASAHEVLTAIKQSRRDPKAKMAGCFIVLSLGIAILLGALLWISLLTGFVTVPQPLVEWYRGL